jgi:putative ABC transport system ATP-binding protein
MSPSATAPIGAAEAVDHERAASEVLESAGDGFLRAEHVGKQVDLPSGPLTILEDVSLDVQRGQALAVVGASGSGKSTLLGILAGLDLPSSGRVRLAGEDLGALSEDGRAALRARCVGFVFQSFQLLPGLTALENVMLPLELKGVSRADPPARDILQRVGLSQRLDHYPRQLSGGEQQRVAIARAFAADPDVLFADEPTGNLDERTGGTIIELLFQLNAERGTTLVLVTHDRRVAEPCHRSIELQAGRILTPSS